MDGWSGRVGRIDVYWAKNPSEDLLRRKEFGFDVRGD